MKGIALAGNLLVDAVKDIDSFPGPGMLANIRRLSQGVGGPVANTGISLAKIDPGLKISAAGRLGDDAYGKYILDKFSAHRIDTEMIRVSASAPTSFTDVMSVPRGERTFFHMRGANAEFSPEDVDLGMMKAKADLLHIGYLLLLDSFDAPDNGYGTVMARFLHDAKEAGLKTSVDVVSDNSGNFPAVVRPALKYCDYVIINEIEVCAVWNVDPYTQEGTLNFDGIRRAMELTENAGVSEKVIVHAKDAGFCLNCTDGGFTVVPSLDIPENLIKGSVGAGDAFCAGALYGIYSGMNDRELLEFASAAAASCLFEANSTDGVAGRDELASLMKKFERKNINYAY